MSMSDAVRRLDNRKVTPAVSILRAIHAMEQVGMTMPMADRVLFAMRVEDAKSAFELVFHAAVYDFEEWSALG